MKRSSAKLLKPGDVVLFYVNDNYFESFGITSIIHSLADAYLGGIGGFRTKPFVVWDKDDKVSTTWSILSYKEIVMLVNDDSK